MFIKELNKGVISEMTGLSVTLIILWSGCIFPGPGRHRGTRTYEKESGRQAVSREEGPARSAGTSPPQSVRHLGSPPKKENSFEVRPNLFRAGTAEKHLMLCKCYLVDGRG